ncbi:hypothetical protein J8M20_20975 [Pseudoalteromonas luteoviolacea]|uniref:glycosyl hydrolase family 18 protein n=1 Tax=Pseudoalteromonas luteoviolacea TaxID=43657 RepID=UPI001B37CF64|nr:glycosyl hydrolase family 18 protein [Pseudoalteromonas luteoviolacea]MBQ4813851.1 hypothetical protein [Pseudoalteromonas luteoviolacea]
MTKKWPDKALVGYVTAYGSTQPANVTTDMIKESLKHHYSVFVYAFGYIHFNNSVVKPSGVSDLDLRAQISDIHTADGIVLLSFGGQNNTFCPNPNDPIEAAQNTIKLCNEYGFDGIDLDLESVSVDGQYILEYMSEIKKHSSLFITAAPQIGGGYGSPATFRPALFSDAFVRDANFTALLVQEYNQYGGAVFGRLKDTDEGFITASFDSLVDADFVPKDTKIVVGEPANKRAGSGLSDPKEITEDIKSGDVLSNNQFGGVMVWALNYDAEQGWSFANGVTEVI